jgi:hypothetical protein
MIDGRFYRWFYIEYWSSFVSRIPIDSRPLDNIIDRSHVNLNFYSCLNLLSTNMITCSWTTDSCRMMSSLRITTKSFVMINHMQQLLERIVSMMSMSMFFNVVIVSFIRTHWFSWVIQSSRVYHTIIDSIENISIRCLHECVRFSMKEKKCRLFVFHVEQSYWRCSSRQRKFDIRQISS